MFAAVTFLWSSLTSYIPFCRELKGESFDIRMISIDFEEEEKFQKYKQCRSLWATRYMAI